MCRQNGETLFYRVCLCALLVVLLLLVGSGAVLHKNNKVQASTQKRSETAVLITKTGRTPNQHLSKGYSVGRSVVNAIAIPPYGIVRPAEFEKQEGVMIAVLDEDQRFMQTWIDMMKVYTKAGHTFVLIDPNAKGRFLAMMEKQGVSMKEMTFLDYPFDTVWIRDYGPEFVVDENARRYIVDGSYHQVQKNSQKNHPVSFRDDSCVNDDALPARIAADSWINEDGLPMKVFQHEGLIAGGNIISDGAGTCFSSDVIYGEEKPDQWTIDDVDNMMREYFGCEKLIVLKPICQDNTGHIDVFMKLAGPNTILLGKFLQDTHFNGDIYAKEKGHCSTNFPNDFQTMENNFKTLRDSVNPDGVPWKIIRVPMHEPYEIEGDWVYRSFLNAQIVNRYVAMPTFRKPRQNESYEYMMDMEGMAMDAFERAMPNHELEIVPADFVVKYGGAVHCLTHEIPAQRIEH